MPHQGLSEIVNWFNEPMSGTERPKLLSKLALLELCGWLEREFDRLLKIVQTTNLNDEAWLVSNILNKTSGFTYNNHFRPMLCRVYGEYLVRKIELEMETSHPNQLDVMKSMLGSLWDIRCSAAHSDLAGNTTAQISFQAPSWVLNQHRVLEKNIGRLELSIKKVLIGL